MTIPNIVQMAKDPAVLWYWDAWHGGTYTMSRAMKGAYTDLLYAQHNNGHLSLDEIKTVLGSDFGGMWPTLQKKFAKDDNGLYYNVRAKTEKEKRSSFTESRRKNLRSDDSHTDARMINTNEIQNRKEKFFEGVETFLDFPAAMRKEFFEYWTEATPSGKKMLFETEKTFEIGKRLARWQANGDKWAKSSPGKSGGKFPDHYDPAFMAKLDGPGITAYRKYLMEDLGLVPKKDHRGDVIDYVKPEQLSAA